MICIIEICKSYQWFLDQADDENAIIALKQCLNELRKNKHHICECLFLYQKTADIMTAVKKSDKFLNILS